MINLAPSFSVLICEDDTEHLTDIMLYLDEIQQENGVEFIIKAVNFHNYSQELNSNYDLLILDFFDGEVEKGETVLAHNEKRGKIKTVIYSSKIEYNKVSYYNLKMKYSCLIGYESKLKTGDNLKDFIINLLFDFNVIESNYRLYNDNDIFLRADIRSIGEKYIKEFIHNFSKTFNQKPIFTISRMSSGLSGAIVLKLEYNGISEILKVSHEVEKLRQEHKSAIDLYKLFPNRLTISINESEFESKDKKVLCILIREVLYAQTLFSFIQNAIEKDKISYVLANLFVDSFALKSHYHYARGNKADWSLIFLKIDKYKFTLIERANIELLPLTKDNKFFNFNSIKNLVLNFLYDNLDKERNLSSKFIKPLVLCHGDLHSKNILVQGTHPVLIDTGGISYGSWCLDICRLIVDLFIAGFDDNSKSFYDIKLIESNLEVVKSILSIKEINYDGYNDNFIFSINWLLNHCEELYGDLFCKFEFQLGLMKEFLQVSYRVGTTPPNKRAIALLAAYMCLDAANTSVIE